MRRNLRISAALDNMTQGLCMFDGATRLILCNERYLEMYGLTREQAYPGCLAARAARVSARRTARSSRTSTNTSRRAKQRVIEGKVFNNVVEVRGRIISITNRPTAGGGWVSTHEDITDQRRARPGARP